MDRIKDLESYALRREGKIYFSVILVVMLFNRV